MTLETFTSLEEGAGAIEYPATPAVTSIFAGVSCSDPDENPQAQAPLTRQQLGWHIREHVNRQLYDEGDVIIVGTAIYTLSDPRDLRLIRYVGQTKAPRRRFLQHLNAARLWMPATTPWWIKSEKLKPLYEWIRLLFSDGYRLPTMVVEQWVPDSPNQVERARIQACLSAQLPLLNVQSKQLPKSASRKTRMAGQASCRHGEKQAAKRGYSS